MSTAGAQEGLDKGQVQEGEDRDGELFPELESKRGGDGEECDDVEEGEQDPLCLGVDAAEGAGNKTVIEAADNTERVAGDGSRECSSIGESSGASVECGRGSGQERGGSRRAHLRDLSGKHIDTVHHGFLDGWGVLLEGFGGHRLDCAEECSLGRVENGLSGNGFGTASSNEDGSDGLVQGGSGRVSAEQVGTSLVNGGGGGEGE